MNKTTIGIKLAYNKGYRISKDGEVFSPEYRILSDKRTTKHGYKTFDVSNSNITYKVPIHRLQAYQKYGDRMFNKGIVVRHKNNNKEDNSYANILIGTQKQNTGDRDKQEVIGYALNASKAHVRRDWKEIEQDRSSGMSYRDLSKKYGVSKGTLSYRFNKSQRVEEQTL